MISAEKARTPVSVCCALLGVSRSGYYEWAARAPSDRALADAWLIEKIREIWAENRKVYGSPRIHADLRLAHGIRVSRKRVERLMRDAKGAQIYEGTNQIHREIVAGEVLKRAASS